MAKKKTTKKTSRSRKGRRSGKNQMSWRDFLDMADNNEANFSDSASSRPEMADVLRNIVKLPCYAVAFAADLAVLHGIDPQDITVRELLVLLNLKHAMLGDGGFNNQVWNRIDGKVPQPTEMTVTGKMSISEALNIANAKKKK